MFTISYKLKSYKKNIKNIFFLKMYYNLAKSVISP